MRFLYPFAFWGLISIPVIIAMYLLKQKYTELQIPSLMLWRAAASDRESQKPWQKLRKNLLMLLQILLALLIVFALANPFISGYGTSSSGVILLDCSMSMGAADEPPNRFEAAKKAVAALINDMAPGDELSIIAMQKNPYIAISRSNDKQRLLSALNGIMLTHTATDTERTADLAVSLNPDGLSDVYCFSDETNPVFGDIHVQPVVFGGGVQNTAITVLSYTVEDGQLICMAKVKNFGAESITNELVFYVNGVVSDIVDFTLAPMEEKELFVSDLSAEPSEIEVKISVPDTLTADDTAYLSVNENPPKKVLLFTEGNVFLENMLGILPNAALYKSTEATAESPSGYFLYVFDGVLPETLPTDGHILLFNPPEGNGVIETGPEIELSAGARDVSAAFRFIEAIDFSVKSSKDMTLPGWAEESVSIGGIPVIAAGSDGSRKIMAVGFDLHNTDLPLKKEFPVFIYNIFQWFAPENNPLLSAANCGDSILFDLPPDTVRARVVSPDGQSAEIAPPFPPDAYDNTDTPGIYLLARENESGETNTTFAVNAFNGEESNLLRSQEAAAGQTERPAGPATETDQYFRNTILFLILAVILLEWWVYSRGI